MSAFDVSFLHTNGIILDQPFGDLEVILAVQKIGDLTLDEVAHLIGASELEVPTKDSSSKYDERKPIALTEPSRIVLSHLYHIMRELYHRDLGMSIRDWLFTGVETPYEMIRNSKWVRVHQLATKNFWRIYPDFSCQWDISTWTTYQSSSSSGIRFGDLDRDPSDEGLDVAIGDRWPDDPIELYDPSLNRQWMRTDGEMTYLTFKMYGEELGVFASLLDVEQQIVEKWVEDSQLIPAEKRELLQKLYSYAREASHRKMSHDFADYIYAGDIDGVQILQLIENNEWDKLWNELAAYPTLLAAAIKPVPEGKWELEHIESPSANCIDFFECFKDIEPINGLALTKFADGHLGPTYKETYGDDDKTLTKSSKTSQTATITKEKTKAKTVKNNKNDKKN